VDAIEPELATGKLADVRAQVDELYKRETTPSVAAMLVLEERVNSAIARL
jgi:hypothetical protein